MAINIRNAAISRLKELNYNPNTVPAIVDAVLEILSKATPKEITDLVILNGKLHINTAMREVFYDNQKIDLTPTEYNLLAYFAKNAGRILTFNDILWDVWGTKNPSFEYIRIFVASLRRKINPIIIKTKVGIGYWMASE